MEKIIENLAKEFFEKSELQIDSFELINQEWNIFLIKIQTPDSGLIIGNNWKNLDSIIHILKLMISKTLDEKVKIHLEVNDYLKTKDERLKTYIDSKIAYVSKTWQDLRLPFFSPYERKKIHSIVSDYNDDKIYTRSIWEWKERRLYICKITEKLSIDIDWDDI